MPNPITSFSNPTKYLSWFIVSFFVYFQFLIQISASVMQNSWADYFKLTPLGVGYLSAAFFYTYLFFQIPVGVIYDRYSAKKVLALATFGLAVGCALFANTKHYELAIFARMLMGACAAFGFIGMLKVISNNFPGKQFSMMMGLSEAFAAVSTMVGIVILAWLMTYITWQQLMILFAIGVLIIMFAVLLFVNSTPENVERINIKTLIKNISTAVTNPTVLITGIYGFFMASVINAFNSLWGIAFLTDKYSISNTLAANIMSMVFLGLAVGCPINGYISKKYGRERESMQICALACALCMSVVIYIKVPLLMLYLLFFLVGLFCAVYVQCFAIIGQTVHEKIQATSMSVTNMLIMSSAPLLQIFIGAILDINHNYQLALSILPIGMLIAFVLCFFMRDKTHGQASP